MSLTGTNTRHWNFVDYLHLKNNLNVCMNPVAWSQLFCLRETGRIGKVLPSSFGSQTVNACGGGKSGRPSAGTSLRLRCLRMADFCDEPGVGLKSNPRKPRHGARRGNVDNEKRLHSFFCELQVASRVEVKLPKRESVKLSSKVRHSKSSLWHCRLSRLLSASKCGERPVTSVRRLFAVGR